MSEPEVYTPTEYRQMRQKEQIIEELKRVPIIQIACEKVGIGRATFYRWRKDDKIFAEQVEEALNHGSSLVSDLAESKLIAAIKDENLTAIMFWLKSHHGKYRNKVEVSGSITQIREEMTEEESEMLNKTLKLFGYLKQDAENKAKENQNEPGESKLPGQPDQE